MLWDYESKRFVVEQKPRFLIEEGLVQSKLLDREWSQREHDAYYRAKNKFETRKRREARHSGFMSWWS